MIIKKDNSLYTIVAVDVPVISPERRQAWKLDDGITSDMLRFRLPTNLSEIFPRSNGEIASYSIVVLGWTSNKDFRTSELSVIISRKSSI